ncbi:superfamily I DNA/RNA helicase [Lysinibacillus parviboronicapiens]|uniref:Superfamily I DNA/RNA helicase n=1 Tax=Lysinibacillus parviboronicapiens TaxID=436516 RepID=A0ABV2PFM7_9BACI
MKIIVAGAGAGKTTSMAKEVLSRYSYIADNKIIYVITYTNAAKNHIKNKIIKEHGFLPNNIKIETSHVFLLHEIIFPFHRLLYNVHFTSVSALKLPKEIGFKSKKLKELRDQNIIHVEEVSKIAKDTLCGKSRDTVKIKKTREKVITILKNYLDCIFMDEAQDMDNNLSQIIQKLFSEDFNLHLVGDPKQDLRGYLEFRRLVEYYPDNVEYKNENRRCPDSHVLLANSYVDDKERQQLSGNGNGQINLVFESNVNLKEFINNPKWDYKFISKKHDIYFTNTTASEKPLESLKYELKLLVRKSSSNQYSLDHTVYLLEKWVIQKLKSFTNKMIVDKIGQVLSLELSKQDRARLYSSIELNRMEATENGFLVHSIEKVKGLEGERCLFILTTDLADYLFKIKTDYNKMMNYLYVALTRSKHELIIFITKEVENKYGSAFISNWYNENILNKSTEECNERL